MGDKQGAMSGKKGSLGKGFAGFGVCAVIVGLTVFAAIPRPSSDLAQKLASPRKVGVWSADLSQDFNYDSKAATQKYDRHDLTVTGRVEATNPLTLEGAHPYSPVVVSFAKDRHRPTNIVKGAVVTFSCHSVVQRRAYLELGGCG